MNQTINKKIANLMLSQYNVGLMKKQSQDIDVGDSENEVIETVRGAPVDNNNAKSKKYSTKAVTAAA